MPDECMFLQFSENAATFKTIPSFACAQTHGQSYIEINFFVTFPAKPSRLFNVLLMKTVVGNLTYFPVVGRRFLLHHVFHITQATRQTVTYCVLY